MREIKFVAKRRGKVYNVETRLPKIMRSVRYKGWYKQQGYILRLVTEHPFANKRGYVPEHRLIIEQSIGRFLLPSEFIHHIDQNRSNNEVSNLRLEGGQHIHAKGHLRGERNPHGQFVCKEPIFNEIKFRLKNTNTGLTTIYMLNQLIATTFRRGQFEFRGRWTGLKDKNGREIYEGDVVKLQITHETNTSYKSQVYFGYDGACVNPHPAHKSMGHKEHRKLSGYLFQDDDFTQCKCEVIGNVFESKHLLVK